MDIGPIARSLVFTKVMGYLGVQLNAAFGTGMLRHSGMIQRVRCVGVHLVV